MKAFRSRWSIGKVTELLYQKLHCVNEGVLVMVKFLSGVVLSVVLLAGCDDESQSPQDRLRTYSVAFRSASSKEALQLIAELAGGPQLSARVKYGVETFRFVYQTTYKGQTVNASGLIHIPQGLTADAPMISLQHGTTFEKSEAPSTSGSPSGVELFASAGYIAIESDYLGYGESAALFHPYYDREYSALTITDMITQVRKYLDDERIGYNDKVFLAGYSEGGYVTLAAAKEIELRSTYGINITAVAAGAGGYDLTGMLKSVTTGPTYANPGYLAFVLMSYNITYDWNRPLEDFFAPQYASALQLFMNGEYSGDFINSKLTKNVSALLNPTFLQALKGDGELALKKALSDNSVAGWNSNLPIRLYHGTEDEVIPYDNSELTLQNFKDAGSADVELTLIQGGTHGNSFEPMLVLFVPWFDAKW